MRGRTDRGVCRSSEQREKGRLSTAAGWTWPELPVREARRAGDREERNQSERSRSRRKTGKRERSRKVDCRAR